MNGQFCSQPIYPHRRAPDTLSVVSFLSSGVRLEVLEITKISCPCQESKRDSSLDSPYPSYYTD